MRNNIPATVGMPVEEVDTPACWSTSTPSSATSTSSAAS